MKNRHWIAVCGALLFTALLPACHSKPAPKDTLRVALTAEPVSLDPALAEDGASLKVLGNTMDGLVGYDGSGHLIPKIAKSYLVSPDGRKVIFVLNPQAKWSDGAPVTAEQFVAALRRALSPATRSKLAPLFFPIKNAQAINEGKLPVERLGVRVEGDKLVVELDKPASYFIHAMTLPIALPVREDLLQANQGSWSDRYPSTGPYHIVEHRPEQEIVLEKNPYWVGPVGIPKIKIEIVPDESTGLNLFEEGKLDILGKIPDAEFRRLKATGRLHTDPFYAVYYLSFNLLKAPFDNVLVRRAIATNISKTEIVAILQTGESPATGWIPKGIEGYLAQPPQIRISSSDLAHVRDVLAHLGPVTARFDSSERNRLVLEKVQDDLAKNLGLRISLENLDWKSYIHSLQTDPPAIFRFAWLAPFNDPIVHLRVFQSGNPNNYSHFKNREYDELVDEISRMPSGPARVAKLKRAQEILISEQSVLVPLYDYVQNHLVSDRVQGFRVNPFGVIRYNELRLAR